MNHANQISTAVAENAIGTLAALCLCPQGAGPGRGRAAESRRPLPHERRQPAGGNPGATFNADGTPDKERRYTVFAQADRQSLVLMQSPAEAGPEGADAG
jgi:hypothetical protein